MAIHIQPRDIRIMRQVFTLRVMTYDQVRRKFFADCYETVARNRLQKLIKYGYFKSFGMEIRGTFVRCLRLTEKAWPIISEKWSFHVDCPHFKSESIEHDVRLGEVILKFEKLDLFERYFSENILQSSSTLKQDPVFSDSVNVQSDGVLILKSHEGGSAVYAIECEISKRLLIVTIESSVVTIKQMALMDFSIFVEIRKLLRLFPKLIVEFAREVIPFCILPRNSVF